MTATRRLVLAAATVLPLVLAACDNKCPTATALLNGGLAGIPQCTVANASAIQAGAQVTVRLRVCPRCDQASDTCTVSPPQGDGTFHLDPLVATCDQNNSCPMPPPPESCLLQACTFTAPAAGDYKLAVYDPTTAQLLEQPFEVRDAGVSSCGG